MPSRIKGASLSRAITSRKDTACVVTPCRNFGGVRAVRERISSDRHLRRKIRPLFNYDTGSEHRERQRRCLVRCAPLVSEMDERLPVLRHPRTLSSAQDGPALDRLNGGRWPCALCRVSPRTYPKRGHSLPSDTRLAVHSDLPTHRARTPTASSAVHTLTRAAKHSSLCAAYSKAEDRLIHEGATAAGRPPLEQPRIPA